ncbi:MAG: zinc ribbon domain-containing protein [Chloroflexota bacterium]|nr:MAG: zinc ribbon domain-containing protein [Chloroflexota bacterium]
MNFDPSALGDFFLILSAWAAAFIVALWLSLIFWTYRDIKARARDPLSRILAVLVVAVLFLPGILIYLILRPAQTLEDEYQQTLEEEALLQAIEESPLCPGCGRRIKDNWSICPNCHTKLRKNCHHCGKLMELPWNICPYCGTPAPGMRREHLTLDEALRPLVGDDGDEIYEPETFEEVEFLQEPEQELEEFEEVSTSEEIEEEDEAAE